MSHPDPTPHDPKSNDQPHNRLVIKPGPWLEDHWHVVVGVANLRRRGGECFVTSCDRNAYAPANDIDLCQPHWFQWRTDGQPEDAASWSKTAREPQKRRRSNAVGDRFIDFSSLPSPVAAEIRFVVGEKVTRGDWTPNRHLLELLTALTQAAADLRAQTLTERRPEDWSVLMQQRTAPSYARDIQHFTRSFFDTLRQGLIRDPWAEDTWKFKHSLEHLVHGGATMQTAQPIHWSRVGQHWLREPAKLYAKECLITGKRAWSTVVTWLQALSSLSRYLESEGIEDPRHLDRSVFFGYLAHLNERGASKHEFGGANTAAALLSAISDRAIDSNQAPPFGSEVFLRYGENVVQKTRQPRPYPDDIIRRIDREVITDPLLPACAREALVLTRWGGLRISELLTLPLDCIRHNGKGGYLIEYFMNKTSSWRRFPIPADLAERLVRWQSKVREEYGDGARHLFPSPHRSSVHAGQTAPWSQNGFRKAIISSFTRNGITVSSVTGEQISGGSIHRYRHTIGTGLLNNGWSQREVQEFLGHSSPTMTAAYAEITDDTLIRKFNEFHNKATTNEVDPSAPVHHPAVEHMRTKFVYELPHGGCTLPSNQTCKTRDNPCSSCAFFEVGGEETRTVQKNHRKRLKLHIEQSSNDREKSLNQNALDAIDRLLGEVEDQP